MKITGSRNWANFLDFYQKFFDRLSKLLHSSCPEVSLIQKFFYLEGCFNYLSISDSEQTFRCFWPKIFSGVVKIAFHVSNLSFLGKLWNIRRKKFLLNCSRSLWDKIKDFLRKICSRIVENLFQVSKVFFGEKLSLRMRICQTFSSVFEWKFLGKLVAVSQLAPQICSRDVYREV